MPYKSLEKRREYYQRNKDKINEKRREYTSRPRVRERIRKYNTIWRENNRSLANKLSNLSKKKYEERIKIIIDLYK